MDIPASTLTSFLVGANIAFYIAYLNRVVRCEGIDSGMPPPLRAVARCCLETACWHC